MTTTDDLGRSIDQAENALLDAMRVSDVASLAELIDDELAFTVPDGTVVGKAADLEAHRTGATRFERIVDETADH